MQAYYTTSESYASETIAPRGSTFANARLPGGSRRNRESKESEAAVFSGELPRRTDHPAHEPSHGDLDVYQVRGCIPVNAAVEAGRRRPNGLEAP